jgi:hypothetical protein
MPQFALSKRRAKVAPCDLSKTEEPNQSTHFLMLEPLRRVP